MHFCVGFCVFVCVCGSVCLHARACAFVRACGHMCVFPPHNHFFFLYHRAIVVFGVRVVLMCTCTRTCEVRKGGHSRGAEGAVYLKYTNRKVGGFFVV